MDLSMVKVMKNESLSMCKFIVSLNNLLMRMPAITYNMELIGNNFGMKIYMHQILEITSYICLKNDATQIEISSISNHLNQFQGVYE